MSGSSDVPADDIDAGPFLEWVASFDAALEGSADADVPCGSCTACCTASQFIHIGPDEADALAHIPVELRFPAPGLPKGHVLLGYDERGHCPMLVEGGCTIYAHRPRTCRTYDCRVFPASGLEVDEPAKAEIRSRARRWRFTHPDPCDQVEHDAVRTAARRLVQRADELPDVVARLDPTQVAVLAVEIRRAFAGSTGPSPAEVRAEVEHRLAPRPR